MKLEVDREMCMSAGRCVLDAPEAFQLDEDDELVTVLPGAADLSVLEFQLIADRCPSGAISLTTQEGSGT